MKNKVDLKEESEKLEKLLKFVAKNVDKKLDVSVDHSYIILGIMFMIQLVIFVVYVFPIEMVNSNSL